MAKLKIIAEYFEFIKHNKKWWLLPVILILLLLGLLIIFMQGSPLAPLIYPLF